MEAAILDWLIMFFVVYGLITCAGLATFNYLEYKAHRAEMRKLANDQWFWGPK